MQIRLNGKRHEIPVLSELTFEQFHKIIVLQNVTDLPSYLSFFTHLPVDDIMNAKLSGASIASVHAQIFNIDIKKTIQDKKEAIKLEGKIHEVNDLKVDTFGKSYILDLIRGKMGKDNFDMYEFCIHAVAVALIDSHSMADEIETFKKLRAMPWVDVLPQGFFLVKKFRKKTIPSTLELMRFTRELKVRRLKINISRRNWQRSEKI